MSLVPNRRYVVIVVTVATLSGRRLVTAIVVKPRHLRLEIATIFAGIDSSFEDLNKNKMVHTCPKRVSYKLKKPKIDINF